MKFEVWKNIVTHSSYSKFRLDLVILEGVEGGPKILGNA